MVDTTVTLRLRLGKKGYLIIPKILREKYGFEEGGWVLVELREEGILLKPAADIDELKKFLRSHVSRLKNLDTKSPRPGELKGVSLEEEFE